ncbi:MAG TPA: patatin-like phospholipase family protein [Iamia sp.]|nr:patatin-like phospholipase family protein [Iamia sp.]
MNEDIGVTKARPAGAAAVWEEIEARRANPGAPRDTKLCLAIEGGGLRGVVSAGMVAALWTHGIRADLFDEIYGSSAGALNGAYFIDGAIPEALPLYYRDVPQFFLRWSRLLRGQPLLALDPLVDETIVRDRPLDFDAVISSGKLHAVAADIGETAALGRSHPQPVRTECFPAARTQAELQGYFRASTRIPLVGGPPVSLSDAPHREGGPRDAPHSYLDAFVTEGVPFEAAVDRGATHLLVATTKPFGLPRAEPAIVNWYTIKRLARHNPTLRDAYARIGEDAHQRGERILALQQSADVPAPGSPAVWCIGPDEPIAVPRMSPDPDRILAAAQAAYQLVCRELGVEVPERFETDPEFRAITST